MAQHAVCKLPLKWRKCPVDYINAHGTATPAGYCVELKAIQRVFGQKTPYISSTKALTGHSLGAAGVQEAIYCLLMMQENFVAASAHIDELDPAAEGLAVVRETLLNQSVNTAMSNSFGFGGTNASLIFKKLG